ncbi:MAG: SufD family Fe-S cluster assembly protein [Vampirovibrionales bacterium]|nr:SufD family Fe-S cluster assembly protein [Vampirovibrionales bacterium]
MTAVLKALNPVEHTRQRLKTAVALNPFEEGMLRTSRNDGSETMNALLASATEAYHRVGFPSRRQEAWKYVNLSALAAQSLPYLLPSHFHSNAIEFTSVWPKEWPTVVALNGRVMNSPLPDGVTLLSATKSSPETLSLAGLSHEALANNDDTFSLLNACGVLQGHVAGPVWVVPKESVANGGLPSVWDWSTLSNEEAGQCAMRGTVVVEESAKATLVVDLTSMGFSPLSLSNIHLNFSVESHAELDVVVIQDSQTTGHVSLVTVATQLSAHARCTLTTLSLGQGLARLNLDTHLNAEGSEFNHQGLVIQHQAAQAFTHSVVNHVVGNTTSHQWVKAILNDQAKHDFDGTIVVASMATGASANQLNNNLLLSGHARALARPQLRIDTDDVQCSHGATVGQLSDDQLFYLLSRGLPDSVSRCLLTYGFAQAALDEIRHPEVKAMLTQRVLAALGQSESPVENCLMDCTQCHSHAHEPVLTSANR